MVVLSPTSFLIVIGKNAITYIQSDVKQRNWYVDYLVASFWLTCNHVLYHLFKFDASRVVRQRECPVDKEYSEQVYALKRYPKPLISFDLL